MLERHPGVPDRLEHIVWMGGAIAEGNVTPAAEFNSFVDPEAGARVFASGIPITMVGLDVTHRALFTRAGPAGSSPSCRISSRPSTSARTASTARRSTTRWPSRT
jgi:inosine-uridine nucleoside N-ribohydrolase